MKGKTKKNGGELKWLAKIISLKWESETYSDGMVMIYAFIKYSHFATMEAIFFIFLLSGICFILCIILSHDL